MCPGKIQITIFDFCNKINSTHCMHFVMLVCLKDQTHPEPHDGPPGGLSIMGFEITAYYEAVLRPPYP